MTRTRRTYGTPATAVLVAALLAAGCSDGPSGPSPDDPFPQAVPAANTMTLDLAEIGGRQAASGPCHTLSLLAVTWTNVNVLAHIAVPVFAFQACLAGGPKFIGDRTWRWTAAGGLGADAWTAVLTGRPRSEDVEWSMRISGTAADHESLLWFDGRSSFEGTSGHWSYYDPGSPSVHIEMLRVTWERALPQGEDRTVSFENRCVSSPDLGDVLTYQLSGTAAAVSHADADAGTTTIRWDTVTGAGETTQANGTRCCWGPRPDYPDESCN